MCLQHEEVGVRRIMQGLAFEEGKVSHDLALAAPMNCSNRNTDMKKQRIHYRD